MIAISRNLLKQCPLVMRSYNLIILSNDTVKDGSKSIMKYKDTGM